MDRQDTASPPKGKASLPAIRDWQDEADLHAYVLQCLQALGLSDWDFFYDRAVRRLGCCDIRKKRISLSRPFVAHYLKLPEEQKQLIHRVVMHELAHALAWVHERARGHGAVWQRYCTRLGIEGERSRSKCDSFESPLARYALIHQVTREVYYYYVKRPRISAERLSQYYIPHQKETSMGQLIVVPIEEIEKP